MDKTIICNINLFDADQSLYQMQEGWAGPVLIAKVPLDHMGRALPDICKEKDVYNVHLFGHEDFIKDIVNTVAEEETKLYSEQKINIEVN